MTETPFSLTEPGERSPVVVSVPHAGTLIPDDDRAAVWADERTILRDADLFVDRLWGAAPALGATLVVARYSRYVLDLNRAPDDVDRDVCDDVKQPARGGPRALIWRLSTEGKGVLARKLTLAELRGRIERIHRPYHDELAALLAARKERFGYAVLVDAHSMPSVGRAQHSDPDVRRADVVPGDLLGKSCSRALSSLVVDHFASAGLEVKPNDPYMGGYITRHHGQPRLGVHAIQIELNRDLYMNEDGCVFDEESAGKLRSVVEALLAKLVSFDPR